MSLSSVVSTSFQVHGGTVQQGHIVGVCIFLAGGFRPVARVDVEGHWAGTDPWSTPFFRHLLLRVTPSVVERTKFVSVTISMIMFAIFQSFRVCSSFSFRPCC